MAPSDSLVPESFAVIGGEGFLGQALIQQLLLLHPSSQVASFGLTQRTFTLPPASPSPSGSTYRFFTTDLTSSESLTNSIKLSGATTIFHTASPHPTASKELCYNVNVEGTDNIVTICKELGVKKLIFTSSLTVCFEGNDLINVDERLPTIETDGGDWYVATKAIAERIVLEANGVGGLLTCSIRLPGIIGPGDRQVLPGLISVLKASQTNFQLGQNHNLFDLVHVKNAVHGHLLAASLLLPSTSSSSSTEWVDERLGAVKGGSIERRILPTSEWPDVSLRPTDLKDTPLPAGRNKFDQFHYLSTTTSTSSPTSSPSFPGHSSTSIAGQSFFITNGEPIPFWSFARLVWFEYNGHVPSFVIPIPTGLAWFLAIGAESWSWLIGSKNEGGLNRVHVRYVVSSLYCNIEKARRVLGYEPVISLEAGIKDAVAAYKAEEKKLEEKVGKKKE